MSCKRRLLGSTGLSVSELGFGAWAIGGDSLVWGYGPTYDRDSRLAIDAARDLGCMFFDTADCYGMGRSESLLGAALRSRRSEVVIATKVGWDFYGPAPRANFDPDYMRFALHQSLRRLQTDYIDLYQLHNPPPEVLLRSEISRMLEDFQSLGKVRCIGVSARTVADGLAALEAGWVQSVQVPYSLLAMEADTHLFPLATARGVGVIAREPLANGFLSGKYDSSSRFPPGDIRSLWPREIVLHMLAQIQEIQRYRRPGETLARLALRFALESSHVSTVICGCKTPAQARENFTAQGRTPPTATAPKVHREEQGA